MKISDIDSSTRITDFENFFDIYEDSNGNYVYNLNEGLYLNVAETKEYTLTTDAFWPLISYKLYGTTRLAWLLMKINNVKASQIFDKKRAGDIITYIEKEYVNSIVRSI